MLQKRPENVNETPPENTKMLPGNINKTISNKTSGTRDIFIFQLSACMYACCEYYWIRVCVSQNVVSYAVRSYDSPNSACM